MNKHTAGPWKAKREPGGRWEITSESALIAVIAKWKPKTDEADARLIAAAPDLLELVRQLLDDDDCVYDHHDLCQTHFLHERPCPYERGRELLESLGMWP